MWDNLKGQFMNHIEEVNADLRAAGRLPLGSELKQQWFNLLSFFKKSLFLYFLMWKKIYSYV